MSFIYPSVLWGLLAIAIPVIVHLFNLQRPKKVFFTNVRLLKTIQETSAKGIKTKQWLILLMRILSIIFIVLAFAQPVIKSENNSNNSPQNAAFYIDNSMSMQQFKGGNEGLRVACAEAIKIAKSYPNKSNFLFTDNNFESRDQFLKSSKEFEDRLTEINYSANSRNANQTYLRQINALSGEGVFAKKDLYWLSDFQKKFFSAIDKVAADTNVNLFLIPINSVTEQGNLWVDSVWLQNPFIQPGVATVLTARIKSKQNTKTRKINLKFKIDNVLVSSSTIELNTNDTKLTNFTFTAQEQGFKKAVIEIDDNPVTFDNQYFFTLQTAKPINVVTIGNDKNNNAAKLLTGKPYFNTSNFTFTNVDLEALNNAELIVVDGFENINNTICNLINKRLEEGSSVVLFPQNNAEGDKINNGLLKFKFNKSAEQSFENQSLKTPDISHPFFHHVFDKITGSENMPIVQPLFSLPANGEKLLFQQNGTSVLAKFSRGQGKIFLYNIPQTTESQGIARHSIFVPLLYKAAFEAAMAEKALAYKIGQKMISLKVNQYNQQNSLKLKSGKNEIVPTQYFSNGYLHLELPQVEIKPGYYEIWAGDKIINSIALNFSEKESDPSTYTTPELKKMFSNRKNIKIFDATELDGTANAVLAHKWGYPIWKILLLCSILAMFAELLLIKFKK